MGGGTWLSYRLKRAAQDTREHAAKVELPMVYWQLCKRSERVVVIVHNEGALGAIVRPLRHGRSNT